MPLELTEKQKEQGYRVTTLGEIAPLKYGKSLPQNKRVSGDVKVYGSSGAVDSHNNYLITGKNIIVGRKGNVGSVFWSEGPAFPIDTVFYTSGSSESDLKYCYYLLKGMDFSQLNADSAVPGLNRDTFERQQVILPSKKEQEKIAEILGSLDDKIEANNALLNSLDELGNALILQKINDVSETCQLSEVAEVVMGQSPAGATLNEDSGGLIFYQGRRDFGFRYPTPRVFTSAPTRVAEPGDILLSVRAPVGDLNRTDEECCVGRGIAAIRAKNSNTAQLFYLLKNMPNLWSPYEGEGTVFSSINRKQVQNLRIPVVENFEDFEDIEKSILSLTQENLVLSESRDLLIRKLIK